jgi:hypothetical protein
MAACLNWICQEHSNNNNSMNVQFLNYGPQLAEKLIDRRGLGGLESLQLVLEGLQLTLEAWRWVKGQGAEIRKDIPKSRLGLNESCCLYRY